MLEDQLFYLKLLEDQIVHAGILTPDIVTLLRRSRGKSWMVNSCFDGHEFIVHSWAKLVLWILQTGGFFIFIFLKTFFTEIYFQFHILQFYTPTARQGAAGPTCK